MRILGFMKVYPKPSDTRESGFADKAPKSTSIILIQIALSHFVAGVDVDLQTIHFFYEGGMAPLCKGDAPV